MTSIPQPLDGTEVAVLARPGRVVDDLLADHADAFAGTIVIDAVNRIGERPMNSRPAAAVAADAGYVRAFNTIGVENPSANAVMLVKAT